MSTAKQQFLTPVGRLVQGDPFEKQTKNMQGQPLVTSQGQPTQRYFVAVAFRKDDPAFGAFYQLLVTVARQSFPQLFDAAGNCTHPRFSWKLTDGDSTIPDEGGRAPATKEGFPGHWVVRFQSSFPPKCFYAGRYAPQEQIQDRNAIRRGYYVRISGTIEGNANPTKPGLYVNLNMVELSAQGQEIVSGPDANAVFGGAGAPALPPGATALPGNLPSPGMQAMPGMPQMPGMTPPPAMPGAQQAMPGMPAFPGHAAPAMPAPVPAMAAQQQTPVMPNPAFAAGPAMPGMPAPGAAMPGMPGMPTPGAAMPGMPAPPAMMPPPPAGPQMTPAGVATGYTVAQLMGGGWTEQTMRQAGYIV